MVELIGYAASFFVAVSLLMVSLVKLRVINLIGASFFTLYGLLIGAWPIVMTNVFIMGVNLYFLSKLFSKDITWFRYEQLESRDGDMIMRFLQDKLPDCHRFYPLFHPKMISAALMGKGKVYGAFRQNRLNGISVLLRLDYLCQEKPEFWSETEQAGSEQNPSRVEASVQPSVQTPVHKDGNPELPVSTENEPNYNTTLHGILDEISQRFAPESVYYMPADYLVPKYRDLGVVGKFHKRLISDVSPDVKRIVCIVSQKDGVTRRYFQRNGYGKLLSREDFTVFELDLRDLHAMGA